MFDFEKLEVYSHARQFVKQVLYLLFQGNLRMDPFLKDQLKRAAISITLNLAEGAGRMTPADKRHFYTIARGSVFEVAALLQLLLDLELIQDSTYQELYASSESTSKMLLGLIRSL